MEHFSVGQLKAMPFFSQPVYGANPASPRKRTAYSGAQKETAFFPPGTGRSSFTASLRSGSCLQHYQTRQQENSFFPGKRPFAEP